MPKDFQAGKFALQKATLSLNHRSLNLLVWFTDRSEWLNADENSNNVAILVIRYHYLKDTINWNTGYNIIQRRKYKAPAFINMSKVCQKGNKAVTNWGYENLCFTINGLLKMLIHRFWYFHFSNFNMTIVKHFLKNNYFPMQIFGLLCHKILDSKMVVLLIFNKIWKITVVCGSESLIFSGIFPPKDYWCNTNTITWENTCYNDR